MSTTGSVLLVAGSPSAPSRSSALLEAVGTRLALRGARIERLPVRELPAQALLSADASHPLLQRAADQLAQARAVVIATPVYKAAYSGVLKAFLDLLPQSALRARRCCRWPAEAARTTCWRWTMRCGRCCSRWPPGTSWPASTPPIRR